MCQCHKVPYKLRHRKATNYKNPKVDRWLYSVFFRKQIIYKETKPNVKMFIFISYPVQLHAITIHNVPHNMQERFKIYWGLYHGILHIAYKGRHIRITYIAHSNKTCATSLAWTAYSSYGNTWVKSKVSGFSMNCLFFLREHLSSI